MTGAVVCRRPVGASAPKIVFVNRFYAPDLSATGQLLTDLASALAATGFNIHVICSRQRYDDANAGLPPFERMAGVSVQRVWSTRFGRRRLAGRAADYATFYGASFVAMLGSLSRGDVLVAKTDPPLMSILAMWAARAKGGRWVNWLQDIFPEVATLLGANPLPKPFDASLRRWRDRSLTRASSNVVLGGRMRERLLHLGVATDKIQIVANWAEVQPDEPKAARLSQLRTGLGLTDEFLVGYSGNLGRAHEFHTVLDAAQILRDDETVVFLMIGGGTGMRELRQAVRNRGLHNFRFVPHQPRESLGDCLAAADVHWVSLRPALEGFIVPSKFYGILAAARPVIFIGDPDGELARDIRTAECGAVIDVGAAVDFARLVRHWKSDPSLRERMGKLGRQLYDERYVAERAFEQWTLLLRTLLTTSTHAVDA